MLFLALGAIGLALESARERFLIGAAQSELDRTFENVATRVHEGDANYDRAIELSDALGLAQARVFAMLIENNPSCLTNQAQLAHFRQQFEVDLICVADERGIVTSCEPDTELGYDMHSSAQSAAFLPAITNRNFVLVQDPMPRGRDQKLSQFVGVSRYDRPGIVQIAVGAERLANFRDLVSPEDIERTSRVRRGGFVKLEGVGEGVGEVGVGEGVGGGVGEVGVGEGVGVGVGEGVGVGRGNLLTRQGNVGSKRISVGVPAPFGLMAGDFVFWGLSVLSVLLLLALFQAIVPNLRSVTHVQRRACLFVLLSVVAMLVAAAASLRIENAGSVREQLLLTLENATARIRSATANAEIVTQLMRHANLVKARAYSLLVASDPTILADRNRLEAARLAFDADDISASDGEGLIVAAVPSAQKGYNLASNPASAQFLSIITNRNAEVVSKPFHRGFDGKLFQLAMVPRPDAPGLLAVGFGESRLAQVTALAGLNDALKSSVNSDGHFTESVPLAEALDRKGYFEEDRGGCTHLCLSARVGDHEVVVGVPTPDGLLAHVAVAGVALVLAVALVLCALGALLPEAVAASFDYLKTFFAFFWGLRNERTKSVGPRQPFWKWLKNPLVLAVLIMFVLTASVAWMNWRNTLRIRLKDDLVKQSEEIAGNVSDSVDNMLLAVAKAIVRHYRTPESLTGKDALDLVHRYDIDEVSVVDANGIARVANLGVSGFEMASHPETAKFNCLLRGAKSFSAPFRSAIEDASVVRKYVGVPFPDAPGYVQVGIDRSRLTSDLRYLFQNSIRDKRFGKSGFPLWVIDDTGEIVANGSREAHADDTLASIGFNAATAPEAGVPFRADFYGRACWAVWSPYADLRIYAIHPQDEIETFKAMRTPLILMSIAYFLFLKMSLALSGMVAQLKKFIVAEHERQKSDMTMAKTIQTSALPIGFPAEDDFAINAKMETAREVGGDFYDFYALPDGRLVFLVADVSGKGVPAALFMMRAKAIIRSAICEMCDDLAAAVALANDSLSDHNDAEMFVTAWIGVFYRSSGRVEYVNAGHNPPIVRRADGTVEWVRSRGGLVFGAMMNVRYKAHTLVLGGGDTLLLYTDGVTEAMNSAQQLFGEARLEQTLKSVNGEDVIGVVSASMAIFTAGAEQSDDITMLTMVRRVKNG